MPFNFAQLDDMVPVGIVLPSKKKNMKGICAVSRLEPVKAHENGERKEKSSNNVVSVKGMTFAFRRIWEQHVFLYSNTMGEYSLYAYIPIGIYM